jgi:ACS family pantothenate transporter-like MFS transporter
MMGFAPKVRRFFIGDKPSSAQEATLLRKIDTVLLAYLCLSQFMNFLDRQNITNAYVSWFNLSTDPS